jgi:hypothetical protein
LTPVGPYGAQRRLQQSPHPLQTFPSTPSWQYVEPAGAAAQVPTVLPLGTSQIEEQQSCAFVQMSPCWTQKEAPSWHFPPRHRFEQQFELAVQSLPAVLQEVFNAAHLPPVQVPLQQLPLVVQAAPSLTQAADAQVPDTQLRVQHSVGALQAAPGAAHAPTLAAQVFVAASHTCEQQSDPVAQTSPNALHVDGEMTGPRMPPEPSRPPNAPASEPPAPVPPAPEPPAPEPPALASAWLPEPVDDELPHPARTRTQDRRTGVAVNRVMNELRDREPQSKGLAK